MQLSHRRAKIFSLLAWIAVDFRGRFLESDLGPFARAISAFIAIEPDLACGRIRR